MTADDLATSEPRIDWHLATAGVPAQDVLDGLDLDDPGDLSEAISNLTMMIEGGHFLTWEAVIRQEQDLPLSEVHEERLDGLQTFSEDEDEERILYIDGMPRPTEAWYETLRRMAPRLRQPVIRTDEEYYEGQIEGWGEIRAVLMEHAHDLSLPPAASTPLEVVPEELYHWLELQECLDEFVGIGQEDLNGRQMSLRDADEHYRVDDFIEALQKKRKSVTFLGLTLQSLSEMLDMPAGDREILESRLREKLGLVSDTDPIAGRLRP